jgi:hypothetical protein
MIPMVKIRLNSTLLKIKHNNMHILDMPTLDLLEEDESDDSSMMMPFRMKIDSKDYLVSFGYNSVMKRHTGENVDYIIMVTCQPIPKNGVTYANGEYEEFSEKLEKSTQFLYGKDSEESFIELLENDYYYQSDELYEKFQQLYKNLEKAIKLINK